MRYRDRLGGVWSVRQDIDNGHWYIYLDGARLCNRFDTQTAAQEYMDGYCKGMEVINDGV